MKNRNDALDFELLFSLAIDDTVICTADQRFVNVVRDTESPQLRRIIDVDELNNRLIDESLAELLGNE